MNLKKLTKEFGNHSILLHGSSSHYHIKEIGKNFILLKDRCPKDKNFGDGNVFKVMLDMDDKDEVKFKEICSRIVRKAKKENLCPEISINFELGVSLRDLI